MLVSSSSDGHISELRKPFIGVLDLPCIGYRSLRKCFEENGDNSSSEHLYKTLSLRFRISALKWFFDGLVQVRGQHWDEKEKEVEHNISTLFLQLIQVLMSRIVAHSISILSYDSSGVPDEATRQNTRSTGRI